MTGCGPRLPRFDLTEMGPLSEEHRSRIRAPGRWSARPSLTQTGHAPQIVDHVVRQRSLDWQRSTLGRLGDRHHNRVGSIMFLPWNPIFAPANPSSEIALKLLSVPADLGIQGGGRRGT